MTRMRRPKARFLGGRRPRRRSGAARGAGAVRAPAGRRGDAAVAVSRPSGRPRLLRPARAAARRSDGRRGAGQPVRARGVRRGALELESQGFEVTVRRSRVRPGRRLSRRRRRAARRAPPGGVRAIPPIAGIVCARGGYGSVQILPLLDAGAHRGLAQGVRRLQRHHGAAHLAAAALRPRQLPRPDAGRPLRRSRPATIATRSCGPCRSPSRWARWCRPASRSGATGEAVGRARRRHLTQLAASLGTPYAFDPPPGCVLFFDEVNERPYRLDRMLTQLVQAGIIGRAAAIVFNELPGCDEPGGEVRGARRRPPRARRLRRPDARGLPVGAHAGRDDDAAVRRPRHGRRARPRRRSSSRKPPSAGDPGGRRARVQSHSFHRDLRHGHGDGRGDAEGARLGRARLRPGGLSADEHVPARAGHRAARRLPRRAHHRRTSTSSASATPSRAATPSSRRCSTARSATARCPSWCASSSCGRRGRSWSPARTARRRRRRWSAGC